MIIRAKIIIIGQKITIMIRFNKFCRTKFRCKTSYYLILTQINLTMNFNDWANSQTSRKASIEGADSHLTHIILMCTVSLQIRDSDSFASADQQQGQFKLALRKGSSESLIF